MTTCLEGLNAFALPNVGLTASGASTPFFLSPSRAVFCACTAVAVASAGSVQMTLAVNTGDPNQASGWTPLVALSSQSGAGTQQGTAQTPGSEQGTAMFRLQWVVVGNGGTVIAVAAGVG